ncbi:sporulation integral membrane protein YtvI [Evansella sp. LMS18]|uniref:sporulation integral membrane protein YtvI n=1 Tax=Evansella sp. LMS18 TaxID=2924033 RepID=UPI0020D1EAE0|nr:sporulation integral membrane protein YtvI [Evansella sp. LMS18]UTR08927.1 sporulation integral membrane protein YtvI [Evansella sp. LMS18]
MTKKQGLIIARFILITLLGAGLFWLLGWFFTISYPFWISTALVWMFIPFIRLLREKLRLPNGLAVFIALLSGLGTIIAIFTGIVFLIIIGVRRISSQVPGWIETGAFQIQQFFNESIFPIWQRITGVMDSLTPEQQTTLQEGIAELGTQAAVLFGELGQRVADWLTQLIIAVPAFLIAFLFIFLAFYFIGKDWDTINRKVRASVPAEILKMSRQFKHMFKYRVLGFLRAQIILMAIASIVVFTGLTILRIDQAFTLALIVGVAEILPYLGSGTILIPWFIFLFLTGNISLGIGIAVVYGVTVAIRQSIEPKILSSSMNLNALSVLISLFIGYQLFGVVGVFLGPFILVLLVILKDVGVFHSLGHFVRDGWKQEEDSNNRR